MSRSHAASGHAAMRFHRNRFARVWSPQRVRSIERIRKKNAAQGIAVITTPDNRWERVDIKSVSLLPNVHGQANG